MRGRGSLESITEEEGVVFQLPPSPPLSSPEVVTAACVSSVRSVVTVEAGDVVFRPVGTAAAVDNGGDDTHGVVASPRSQHRTAAAASVLCACCCRNPHLSVELARQHAETLVVHAVPLDEREFCSTWGTCGGKCKCRPVALARSADDTGMLGVYACPICVSPKDVAEHVSVGLGAFFFDLRFVGVLLSVLALLSLPLCIFNSVRTAQLNDGRLVNGTSASWLPPVSWLGATTFYPSIYLRSDIVAVYSWQSGGITGEANDPLAATNGGEVELSSASSAWPLWVVLLQCTTAIVAFTGVMWLRLSAHTRVTNLQNRNPDPLHYTLVASALPPCGVEDIVACFAKYGLVARITAVAHVGATLVALREKERRLAQHVREVAAQEAWADEAPPAAAAAEETTTLKISALQKLQEKLEALRTRIAAVELRAKSKLEERARDGRNVHTAFVSFEDSACAKSALRAFQPWTRRPNGIGDAVRFYACGGPCSYFAYTMRPLRCLRPCCTRCGHTSAQLLGHEINVKRAPSPSDVQWAWVSVTNAGRWRFLAAIIGALALGAMLALNIAFMAYELTRLAQRGEVKEDAIVEVEEDATVPSELQKFVSATPSLVITWSLVLAIATVRMLAGLAIVPTAHKCCGKFRFRDQTERANYRSAAFIEICYFVLSTVLFEVSVTIVQSSAERYLLAQAYADLWIRVLIYDLVANVWENTVRPLVWVKRCATRLCARSQSELNAAWVDPAPMYFWLWRTLVKSLLIPLAIGPYVPIAYALGVLNVTGIYLSRKLRMLRYSSQPPRYGLRLTRFANDVNVFILIIALFQFTVALWSAGRVIGVIACVVLVCVALIILLLLYVTARKAVRLWWRSNVVAKMPRWLQHAALVSEGALVAQRLSPKAPVGRRNAGILSMDGIEMVRREADADASECGSISLVSEASAPTGMMGEDRISSLKNRGERDSATESWDNDEHASAVETSGVASVPFSSIMCDFEKYEPTSQSWGFTTIDFPQTSSSSSSSSSSSTTGQRSSMHGLGPHPSTVSRRGRASLRV